MSVVATSRRLAPGLSVAVALAAIAWVLGGIAPIVGAPAFGVALGVAARVSPMPSDRAQAGSAFAARSILQLAVVLYASGIGLNEIADVGSESLPVMLGTFAAGLVAAAVVGRALRMGPNLRLLIGVGTSICGVSAIAAVSTVVAVTTAEIGLAVTTIFVFNLLAVFVFPAIGHLLELGPDAFGLWAGTAINDTSSVVAAGYTYGAEAGDAAVIVKLTRTTLIIPVVAALVLVGIFTRRRESGRRPRVLPLFLVWFLAASALNTVGAIPPEVQDVLADLALFLVTVALVAIGLVTRLDEVRRAGFRPLAFGAVLWITVAATSLLLQAGTGKL